MSMKLREGQMLIDRKVYRKQKGRSPQTLAAVDALIFFSS